MEKTAIQKMLDEEPVSMTDPTYGEAAAYIAETWKNCEVINCTSHTLSEAYPPF